MSNGLDNSLNSGESLSMLIGSEGFGKLSDANQQYLLASANKYKAKDGGFMGKIFGVKPAIAAMNIAVLICVLILIVGLKVDEQQFWDKAIPILAATIGYLFGKGKE